jgi:hypothetical protein
VAAAGLADEGGVLRPLDACLQGMLRTSRRAVKKRCDIFL